MLASRRQTRRDDHISTLASSSKSRGSSCHTAIAACRTGQKSTIFDPKNEGEFSTARSSLVAEWPPRYTYTVVQIENHNRVSDSRRTRLTKPSKFHSDTTRRGNAIPSYHAATNASTVRSHQAHLTSSRSPSWSRGVGDWTLETTCWHTVM